MERVTTAESLGNIIRAERKRQGLTQLELADVSGVGITFVSQLENGKATAELGKALSVVAMLGIDLFADRRA